MDESVPYNPKPDLKDKIKHKKALTKRKKDKANRKKSRR